MGNGQKVISKDQMTNPMARHEEDREDLLAEATALVERAELVVEGAAESVVIGFRRDGCASIYCGCNTRRAR